MAGNGATPSYARVTSTVPPAIIFNTTNLGNVGYKNLIFTTTLVSYPNIIGSKTFLATIYSFVCGPAIALKYYQITKAPVNIRWKDFTLSPSPAAGTMQITYIDPKVYDQIGNLLIQPISWLIVDLVGKSLKVKTNDFANVGVFNITI